MGPSLLGAPPLPQKLLPQTVPTHQLELLTKRGLQAVMLWVVILASVAQGGLGHSPLPHLHLGHHVDLHHHLPPPPICKLEFEKVTKELCHIKPKRVCETKTHEYKVVTGHEKGDCK